MRILTSPSALPRELAPTNNNPTVNSENLPGPSGSAFLDVRTHLTNPKLTQHNILSDGGGS